MKAASWLGAFVLCGALWGCGGDDSGSSASALCEDYCAKVDECGYSQASCLSSCEEDAQTAASISGACATAVAAEGRCIADLSCERFDDWVDDTPDSPCQAEDAASISACN